MFIVYGRFRYIFTRPNKKQSVPAHSIPPAAATSRFGGTRKRKFPHLVPRSHGFIT